MSVNAAVHKLATYLGSLGYDIVSCCSLCSTCVLSLKFVNSWSSSLLQAVVRVLSIHLQRYVAVHEPMHVLPSYGLQTLWNSVGAWTSQASSNLVRWCMQPAKRYTQGLRELFICSPSHCLACSERFQQEHDHEALVYHGAVPTCWYNCLQKYLHYLLAV